MFKKLFSFLIILSMTLVLFTGVQISVSAEESITIDETNFPDENFRTYISSLDTSNDGSLSESEITAVTSINVNGKSISNLKGIEFFTELTYLLCNNNPLGSLNVSNNTELTDLDCCGNQLTSLDLSNNTKLTYLNCRTNNLTSLDLSKNTELTTLWCGENQFVSLDLSKNTNLVTFSCYTNPLTSITIPESVTSFGTAGFKNCNSLSQIIYIDGKDVSSAQIPAAATHIKYKVNGGKAEIVAIDFGTDNNLAVIPETINGHSVAEITDKDLMKKVVHTHTGGTATCEKKAKCEKCDTEYGELAAHNYENDVCTICGAAKPAVTEPTVTDPTYPDVTDAPTGTGSSPAGTSPVGTSPITPSRPSVPSNPNPSSPSVTTAAETTTVTVTTAEEIIADGDYTGEDVSAGAADNSDDGGITDMSMVVIVIAIAAVIVAAVLIKKIVF